MNIFEQVKQIGFILAREHDNLFIKELVGMVGDSPILKSLVEKLALQISTLHSDIHIVYSLLELDDPQHHSSHVVTDVVNQLSTTKNNSKLKCMYVFV